LVAEWKGVDVDDGGEREDEAHWMVGEIKPEEKEDGAEVCAEEAKVKADGAEVKTDGRE
jgi:hypothetical protein